MRRLWRRLSEIRVAWWAEQIAKHAADDLADDRHWTGWP